MSKNVISKKKVVIEQEPEVDPVEEPEEDLEEELEDDEFDDGDEEEVGFDTEYNEDLAAIAAALVSEDGESIADIMADIRDQLRNFVKIGKMMMKR